MAQGNANILHEYLVSLGFRVDPVGFRRLNQALGVTNRTALITSGAVAGVAYAVENMVRSFAHQMTNLYYMSQRTKTPIANLQGFAYAAKQVGIDSAEALQSVEALQAEIRKNPGKQALLRSLGVDPQGGGALEQLHSLVEQLTKKFPYFVAQQFGEQFGIPEQMFFQLTHYWDELLKREKEHKELLRSMGVDSEQAGRDALDYSRNLAQLGVTFDVLKQKAAAIVLPDLTKFLIDTNKLIGDLQKGEKGSWELWRDFAGRNLPEGFNLRDFAGRNLDVVGLDKPGSVQDKLVGRNKGSALGGFQEWLRKKDRQMQAKARGWQLDAEGEPIDPDWPTTPGMIDKAGRPAAAAGTGSLRERAAAIARQFGIPPSIFASMIGTESNWNPNAVSNKGAVGLTQLMSGAASETGVKDRYDPQENMRGGAEYLRKQFDRFGSWRDALAAYNFGPNRDFSPAYSTYADPILRKAQAAEAQGAGNNVTLNQRTEINVQGGNDAKQTAGEVEKLQRGVNSDLVRSFSGVPR